jgi:hypothetical protein
MTINEIINNLTQKIANKEVIPPNVWIDYAVTLNLLLADEQEKLYSIYQTVSEMKMKAIESGDTVAKANCRLNASVEWKDYNIQKGKIDRVIELIRLSKIQSRIADSERRGY